MRESKVPTFDTEIELMNYIKSLETQEHDYGTCVYAMSMAATAAFNYMARKLGVTGFQAGCADLDILRRTRNLESGFKILNYENVFYPQCCNSEYFPSHTDIINSNKIWAAKEAKKKIAAIKNDSGGAHPDVLNHWELLASLATDEEIAESIK